MNVLLTGATGYLGRRVLRDLLAAGCAVRCSVRFSSDISLLHQQAETVGCAVVERDIDQLELIEPQTSRSSADGMSARPASTVEIVRASLNDFEHGRQLTRGCDVVCHVAAALSGSVSSLVTNTVVPTRELIRAASTSGVSRFVLVSSLGVYGPQQLGRWSVLDESCPLDAAPQKRDPYSYSKILQEQAAVQTAAERGLPLAIVRPGVIYGDERSLLCSRVGLQFGGLLLRMGGRQFVPCVHVDNCSAGVTRAVLNDAADGEAINLLDDRLPCGREVIRSYRRTGQSLRVIGIPQFALGLMARCNEIYSRWSANQIPPVLTRHRVHALWKPLKYTNTKARRLLDWQPATDFQTTMQRATSQP